MNIQCTDQAVTEITRQININQAKLKLAHDAEGCGCIMSGIAQLWVVDQEDEFDLSSPGETFPIWYDARHEVFFEDEIQIDYVAQKKSFVLKSNNQIYNSTMQLIEKRKDYLYK